MKKIIILLVVCAAAYGAYMFYQSNKKKKIIDSIMEKGARVDGFDAHREMLEKLTYSELEAIELEVISKS